MRTFGLWFGIVGLGIMLLIELWIAVVIVAVKVGDCRDRRRRGRKVPEPEHKRLHRELLAASHRVCQLQARWGAAQARAADGGFRTSPEAQDADRLYQEAREAETRAWQRWQASLR